MAEITKKVYKVNSNGHVETQNGGAIEATCKPKNNSKTTKTNNKEIITSVPSKFLINQVTVIALKLALKGAYDSYGRLIYQKKPLIGTNIVDLIHSVVTEGNSCPGLAEFLQVLKNCGLKPSTIANKSIRKKISLKPSTKDKRKGSIIKPVVFPNINANYESDSESCLNEREPCEHSSEIQTNSPPPEAVQEPLTPHTDPLPQIPVRRLSTGALRKKKQRKVKRLQERSPYNLRDNPASFASADKLFQEARKIDASLKKDEVIEWLKSQLTYTLHKPVRRNFSRNRIIVSSIDEQWEADLVEMQEFAQQNNGYRYIITIIDSFSKYAWAFPIKQKTALAVTKVFTELFKLRKPVSLRTDKGKEFVNSNLQKLLKDNNIRFYTSSNRDIKCAIVERFNRTLKSKMFKFFTAKGTRKFTDVLQALMSGYNKSYHRTIKMSPNSVNENNSDNVFRNMYGVDSLRALVRKNKPSQKLKDGQEVRMKYKLKPFDKAFYPNWTDQVYKIDNVDKNQENAVYEIKDCDGNKINDKKFYDKELQAVNADLHRVEKVIRRRIYKGKIQYLVKWLGYPASYNSWINLEDLKTLT
ncbi:uncharacterized protein LOC107370222 [Tetranychus urticae]|uniref:uncharacterized protein LOC107370222 n=1 Tax=Tetranychus urticae TaxID=32264 RepID=UPI00077BC00F|nr:uncharacterized protein LOC107370222 [Tetranychus urticae]